MARSAALAPVERAVPYNAEAERAILGSVLLDNRAVHTATQIVTSGDFFGEDNRLIFEAMTGLSERSEAIDTVTLRAELERRDVLERAGGPAYVSSLIDGVPVAVNVEQYARTVREKARLRHIARHANALYVAATNGAQDIDAHLAALIVIAQSEAKVPATLVRLDEGHYRLTEPRFGIALEVDHLRRERGHLHGELTVRCSLLGARTTAGGVLSSASFNLSTQQSRKTQASYLASRAQTGDAIDWIGLLEELCWQVLTADREGDPAIALHELPRPAPDDALVVDGMSLLPRHPVIVFGDGGCGKSLVALYLAGRLSQQGMRVGLLDWELSADEHRRRLEDIFGPDMPPVQYLRCDRPLCEMVDAVRRMLAEHALEYLILDSIAFACDGPPEAAEVASRYFQALRRFGEIGSLHVAHMSKAEGADRKPFGSVFWHNGARATWYAKRAEDEPGDNRISVGLYNRKANLGPLRPAVGYEISFGTGSTRIRPVDVDTVPELSAKLSVRHRMAYLLRRGEMEVSAIAEAIDAKPDTVQRTARRYRQQFTVMPGGRLGLAERTR